MEKLTVSSKIGFFLGDVWAILPRSYDKVSTYILKAVLAKDVDGEMPRYVSKKPIDAGARCDAIDGIYVDRKTGLEFAAGRAKIVEEYCRDSDLFAYEIKSGLFGLIPLEMSDRQCFNENYEMGRLILGEGEASIEGNDGLFTVTLPTGRQIIVDTRTPIV